LLFKENTREREERRQILDGAMSDWRDAEARLPAQRLSAGARANVRTLARQSAQVASERPLARLFQPATRLAAAAAVPALILAVSFGWLLGGGGEPNVSEISEISEIPEMTSVASMSIESRKIDGQAVFDIANGGRVHRVYKSTSAKDIEGADLFVTIQGAFSDTLDGDDDVVFYRID
jgi:hypothetical protein